jgi:hypothetical protein
MSDKSPADIALENFIEGKIPKELRSNYEHDISMIRGGWYAAMDFFKKLSEEIESWRSPVEQLKGSLPLVLYFGNEADRDEFIDMVKEAKPGMRAFKL